MSEGKRKAGFFAKLIGTVAWGLVLALVARVYLGESFLGIQVSIATYLMVGLCWPVVWGLFWLARVITPMPFELLPRFFELILVGPGHLVAYVLFGTRPEKDEPSKDAKDSPAKAEAAPPPPAEAPAPAEETPPAEA
ncbi:MAG: hypothetical protein JKY65_09795 [Planctomycetes bacterium]|nr:hypothetical protein [Planctomycetota bacterium]